MTLKIYSVSTGLINKAWERASKCEFKNSVWDFLHSRNPQGPHILWPLKELQDSPNFRVLIFTDGAGLDGCSLLVKDSLKRVTEEIQRYREQRGKEQ